MKILTPAFKWEILKPEQLIPIDTIVKFHFNYQDVLLYYGNCNYCSHYDYFKINNHNQKLTFVTFICHKCKTVCAIESY